MMFNLKAVPFCAFFAVLEASRLQELMEFLQKSSVFFRSCIDAGTSHAFSSLVPA
jgi:hypothetical protein